MISLDEDIRTRYWSVVKRVDELGYVIPSGSRFALYAELLKSSQPVPFDIGCILLKEVLELENVLVVLGNELRGRKDKRLVAVLSEVCGNGTPLDTSEQPGRDCHVELLFHAFAERAGIAPKVIEPDLVVGIRDQVTGFSYAVGLACKRVRSVRQLEKRLVKASDQIRVANCQFGVIALDLSDCGVVDRLMTPHQIPISESEVAVRSVTDDWRLASKYIDDYVSRTRDDSLCSKTLGIVLRTTRFAKISEGRGALWGVRSMTTWMPMGDSRNQMKRRLFALTRDMINHGMPGVYCLDPHTALGHGGW